MSLKKLFAVAALLLCTATGAYAVTPGTVTLTVSGTV